MNTVGGDKESAESPKLPQRDDSITNLFFR